jgi:peptidoglycan/LPS O-acetylase OafA/YrhL
MKVREYLPGLDGLRALSIFLVFFSHAQGTAGFPPVPGWLWHAGDLGNLGVRVFFVISGFLITLLLLREESRTGSISISQFYIRRAFRILPAVLVFLALMLAFRALGLVTFPTVQWLQGLFFLADMTITTRIWSLGHLWSLAVEEQFYLIWPAAMLLMPRRWRVRALVVTLLLAPVYRVAAGEPGASFWSTFSFPQYLDAIALGCLLAVLRFRRVHRTTAAPTVRRRWYVILPFLLIVLNGLPGPYWLRAAVVLPAMHVVIATMIYAAAEGAFTAWQPLLDAPPVAWFGRISYSLYLWQEMFLNPYSHYGFARFPGNVLLAIGAGVSSFYLVERPMLAVRRRARAATSAPSHLASPVQDPPPRSQPSALA